MKKIKLDEQAKALVLVAHPDDETIWMGGVIMLYPRINWTIFSLCRLSDKDRAPKFRKVCLKYHARDIITDLDDEDRLSVAKTIPEIKKLIKENIDNNFQYIFTHGENGEYGHPRHVGVNMAVRELLEEKYLKPETVFYFHYQKKTNEDHEVEAGPEADLILSLDDETLNKKKDIVTKMYGYPTEGIDVGYCTNPEAFKVVKY